MGSQNRKADPSFIDEPMDEQQLSAGQQRELWQAWVEKGPDGPIEDGETDIRGIASISS